MGTLISPHLVGKSNNNELGLNDAEITSSSGLVDRLERFLPTSNEVWAR